MLTGVKVELSADGVDAVHILARCKLSGQTGVEMEALTAASVAALTIYDMCKAVDRGMTIETIRLLRWTCRLFPCSAPPTPALPVPMARARFTWAAISPAHPAYKSTVPINRRPTTCVGSTSSASRRCASRA